MEVSLSDVAAISVPLVEWTGCRIDVESETPVRRLTVQKALDVKGVIHIECSSAERGRPIR